MASTENPFPGMNPFLQDFWPDIHTRLIVHLSNALQPQLPGGLFARLEESVAIGVEDDQHPHPYRSDVLVAHVWGGEEAQPAEGGDVAVMEPDVYRIIETEKRRWVEIIDVRSGGKLVTVVEILSPTNKGAGSKAYRTKTRHLRDAGINLVEIDLLRGGSHVLAVPLSEIPEHKRTPYAVCVSPADDYGCYKVWHVGLLERLPAIPIPLREDDPAATVDIQPLVNAAFRDGGYSRLIDYEKTLDPPLSPEAVARVRELLSAGGSSR